MEVTYPELLHKVSLMWIRLVGQSLGKCSGKRIIEGLTAMAEDLERSGGGDAHRR